jgi:hypothetical protein
MSLFFSNLPVASSIIQGKSQNHLPPRRPYTICASLFPSCFQKQLDQNSSLPQTFALASVSVSPLLLNSHMNHSLRSFRSLLKCHFLSKASLCLLIYILTFSYTFLSSTPNISYLPSLNYIPLVYNVLLLTHLNILPWECKLNKGRFLSGLFTAPSPAPKTPWYLVGVKKLIELVYYIHCISLSSIL